MRCRGETQLFHALITAPPSRNRRGRKYGDLLDCKARNTLDKFQNSKLYDLLAASPLIVFYGFALAGLWPQVEHAFRGGLETHAWSPWLEGFSLLTSLGFLAVEIILFLVRVPPVHFSETWTSRLVAVFAANSGLAFLILSHVSLSPPAAILSSVLNLSGSALAIFVLSWLGQSFSILPQARRFVATGPYGIVRHPLYMAELIGSLGLMMQFQQPWSTVVAVVTFVVQFPRMDYEEQVLSKAFPEYRAYSARTARLLPGIY